MPVDRLGQLISFATEIDPDEQYKKYIWVRVSRKHDTIKAIAARRGHLEMAQEIRKLNGVRDITTKLRKGRLLRIPGTLEQKLAFTCHPQDSKRPIIKDGYAVFDVVSRYGEKGITHFRGYNPIVMDVPIHFEGWGIEGAGPLIMERIRTLERMAGRGQGFKGAASGPPAIIRVNCTDNHGNIVPLIPTNYQWTPRNPTAPMWRVNGIDWDEGALSDDAGNIVRQTATVHLWEYTPINVAPKLTERAKAKGN